MNAPRYLHFQLTERCNLACPGCYLRHRTGQGAPAGDIEATVFAPLAAAGTRYVTLTGGEPLLHPEWREICEAAARHFDSVQLVCNGTLLTPDIYEALLQAGVTDIKVSLDGPEPAVHDALRGVQGCFDRVLANLRAITALPPETRGGIELGCICTVSPQNVNRLRELASLAEKIGLDNILFQPFHPYGFLYPPPEDLGRSQGHDAAFLATLAGQLEHLKQLRQARPGFLDNSLTMLDRFLDFYTAPLGPEQICGANRFAFVNSRFDVRGCLFCHPLGSLKNHSLVQIRESAAWQGFDAFRSSCRRCLMGCQFVDRSQDLAEQGFACLAAADLDGAQAAFNASLALEYSVPAGHGLGAVLLQQRNLVASRQLLETARTHKPKNRFILADLGWNKLLGNDLPGAREAFDASLALGPSFPAIHGAGLVRYRQGELQDARHWLEQAQTRQPDHYFVLNDLGTVFLRLEDWPALEGVVAHLRAVAPEKAASYRLQGLAAKQRGDYATALPALAQARDRAAQDDPWPVFDYGLVCLDAGETVQAKDAFNQAIGRDAQMPWFHYRLAIALAQLGEIAQARKSCTEALRLDPDQEVFHRFLATLGTGDG